MACALVMVSTVKATMTYMILGLLCLLIVVCIIKFTW
jgi:hypothetical protein